MRKTYFQRSFELKECNKGNHKMKLYNVRQFYLAILVLEFYCYCGDNVKYKYLSKHLFERKQQHDS